MEDQSYMVCYYHGSVHYCWPWQYEWEKFTKKDSAVKFSCIPKIMKNEGEMMEELTIRRRRAWISTLSIKMRGFVIGILCLAKLQNSGTNLILTESQHYILVIRRDGSGFILNSMLTELNDARGDKK